MKQRLVGFLAALTIVFSVMLVAQAPDATGPWSARTATRWYADEPWLAGSNYLPSNAVNELEMWQAATFDPKRIDTELGWAQSLGMNTMRVFLHDLLWSQDQAGFLKRIDTFLAICHKHRIRPIFVLFDSCWNPHPHLGPQPAPTPGVHNSQWVQSPGADALKDPAQYPRLEAYVKGVVGALGNDRRIIAWMSGTNPITTTIPATANWNPRTRTNWCWRCCQRLLRGLAAFIPGSP